jgi:hypothetical protein
MLAVGCVSDKQPLVRGPLSDLILRVDPRFDGLINQTCSKFKDDKCLGWDVAEYKLSDKPTEELLVKLEFICKINGERFGICGNGFCQKAYRAKKFLGITTGWEQYTTKSYHMEKDKKFLVEASTYCMTKQNEISLGD